MCSARSPVGHEMNVRKFPGLAVQKASGRGLRPLPDGPARLRKISLNVFHLGCGLEQDGKFRCGLHGVADQEQLSIGSHWSELSRKQRQRTGRAESHIFNPKVRFWSGNKQSFE